MNFELGDQHFDFNELPVIVQIKVLSHLNLYSKKQARRVCKTWRHFIDTNFLKKSFHWRNELKSERGLQAAKPASFEYVLPPLSKFWRNNLKDVVVDVEDYNPESDNALTYWVAKIIDVNGYFVVLRFLSPSEEEDNKENCIDFVEHLLHTLHVHYIGRCAEQDLELRPCSKILQELETLYNAANDDGEDSHWRDQFLPRRLIGSHTIPRSLRGAVKKVLTTESLVFKHKLGDSCEIFDKNNGNKLRLGVIKEIIGSRLLIQYKGDRKKEEVGCHRFSKRFYPCGWSKTVGYETEANLYTMWYDDPPKISAEALELEPRFTSLNVQLIVGMRLEVIDPFKPSRIVGGVVTKVLKWGYFIVEINCADVEDYGPDSFCRHVTSPDVFYCGFAQENGIDFIPPGYCRDKDLNFSWAKYFEETPGSQAVPSELISKDFSLAETLFNFGDRLEAIDWRDGFTLRPSIVVAVKGMLIKIHYDNFPNELDQWVHTSSLDIYPIGWAQLTKYPLKFPGDCDELWMKRCTPE